MVVGDRVGAAVGKEVVVTIADFVGMPLVLNSLGIELNISLGSEDFTSLGD